MAVRSFSFSVGDASAVALTVADDEDKNSGSTIWVYNDTHGSHSVSIGGSNVTYANGLHVYGGTIFGPMHLAHGETLYAIAAAGDSCDIRILANGA